MKNTLAVSLALLILISCNGIVGPEDNGVVIPVDKNEAPYFVGVSEPDYAVATGYNVLLGRKHQLSFDSTVKVTVRHLDSNFICSGSKCQWQYIDEYDTVVDLTSSFNAIDTERFFRSVPYAFFDSENDSCEARIELVNKDGVRIQPDSVWGDVYTRPGMNKRLSATFHGIISHESTFYEPAPVYSSSFKIVLTLVQINDSHKSCQNTISNFESLGDTDSVVSDKDFFRMLEGNWKLKIEPTNFFIIYRYTTRNLVYTIRNDSLFGNDATMPGNGRHFENRTGWTGIIPNLNPRETVYFHFSYTLVGSDTLVASLRVGQEYCMAVFMRDTSVVAP